MAFRSSVLLLLEQGKTLIFILIKIRRRVCAVYSFHLLLTEDRLLTVACSFEGGLDSSKAIKMSLFPERAHSWIGVSMDCNKGNHNFKTINSTRVCLLKHIIMHGSAFKCVNDWSAWMNHSRFMVLFASHTRLRDAKRTMGTRMENEHAHA